MLSYAKSVPIRTVPSTPTMNQRTLTSSALVVWSCLCLFIASASRDANAADLAQSRDRPNIVFIMADDMGWSQPAFNGGNPDLTPNIGRLANDGVRLNQFYGQSVCSPSRTALMTGRYPFRTWMDWRSEDFGKPEFLERLGLTLPKLPSGEATRRIHGLPTSERTIAEVLRDAGYYTAITGKWHLGEWKKEHLPLQRGFMHQYGYYAWGVDYMKKTILHHTPSPYTVYDWHRNEVPLYEEGYTTDLITDEAVRVIADRANRGPFFLYVPYGAVHGPLTHAPRYIADYGVSGATLKILDDGVGRILVALEQSGVSENTLVIFTNDNGGLTEESNRPLRGKKDTNWEGGVRIPAVLRWPGKIAPKAVHNGLMHMTDFFPTLIAAAGAQVDPRRPIDGYNLLPALLNSTPSPRNEIVFEVTGSVRVPAIRQGDYKLVGHELFNIAADPNETKDIATLHPDVVARLKQRILDMSNQRIPLGEMSDLMSPALPYVYGEMENRDPPAWLRTIVDEVRSTQPKSWFTGETPWPKPPPPVPPLF
jgi:arylsulfatase A-like enzyme